MAEKTEVEETSVPKGAKKPQDRQAKVEKPKVDKVEIEVGEGDEKRTIPVFRVTIRSFTVEVPEESFTDYEVIELIAEAQRQETPMHMAQILARMLPAKDYARMKEALRGPNGRVSIADVSQFYMDLMGAINPS